MYYTSGCPEEGLRVRHYGRVWYKNLYPGIDLEFIASPGTNKPVEYNFYIRPGADPSIIKMRYEGPQEARLENGKLALQLSHTLLTESIPASWSQPQNQAVQVSYKLLSQNENSITLGFLPAKYDRKKTLVIDPAPTYRWGTYYGGPALDQVDAITTFGLSEVYVAGTTSSISSIATSGAYSSTFGGSFFDGFLAKLDTSGQRLWASYFGGDEQDGIAGIDADTLGNIYLAGATQSITNISTTGSHQPFNGGGYDGLIVSFDEAGNRLWATFYGGNQTDYLNEIACDNSGNLYVAGSARSPNAIATAGAHQTNIFSTTSDDALIAKFTTAGARVWGSYYGGNDTEAFYTIAVGNDGFVYPAGFTQSGNNIASPGAYQSFLLGQSDGMIVKFNPNGQRIWGTYYGGSVTEGILGVAADNQGNVYISGGTDSPDNISTPGAHQVNFGGGIYDAFLVKLNSSGSRLWATYIGGDDDDRVFGSRTSASGILIAGLAASNSGISTAGAFQSAVGGGQDAFLSAFDSSGVREWGTYYGGTSADYAYAMDRSIAGNIYIGGQTSSTSSIASAQAFQPSYDDQSDGFLARFASCQLPLPIINADSTVCAGGSINLNTPNIPGATYTWTGPNGFTSSQQNPVITNATAGSAGTYSLLITLGGCSSLPATFAIAVKPLPTASISTANLVCAGTSLSFAISASSTVSTYAWNFDDNQSGTQNTSTQSSPSHVFNLPGNYQVEVILTFDCLTDTFSTPVVVSSRPAATITSTPSRCNSNNGTASVTASGGSGSYTYLWSNGATGIFATGLAEGSYTAIVTDQNGCKDTSQVNVSSIPPAQVLVAATDTLIQLGDSVRIAVTGGVDFTWTPNTGLNCTDCPNVIASPLKNTTYFVTGKDTNGCAYSRSVTIVVEIVCNELFVPDIFSPNGIGDVKNEKLCVYSNCIKEITFAIYNRWGEQIFFTNDKNLCWDGTLNGKESMTGPYVYRLYVEQLDGQKIEKSGNITLIR
jgi:gliding motility-associated-like protein